jgi:hypothetical protein
LADAWEIKSFAQIEIGSNPRRRIFKNTISSFAIFTNNPTLNLVGC